MSDFPHDYLYHTTFLHNLDGIAARGLTRSGGSQFNEGYSAHSQGRVFLSEWDAVSYWMSRMEDIANYNSDFKEEDDLGWTPVVLRVDVAIDIDALQDDTAGKRDSAADSYFLEEDLPPDVLEVWTGDDWEFMEDVDTDSMLDRAIEAAEYQQEDETSEDEEFDEWDEPKDGWYEPHFELFRPEDE